jgi:hypothetical protein
MPIKLNGATSGSVELGVPDVVGSDVQNVLLPSTAGTLDRLERSGNILQVVYGETNTQVTISSNVESDTGLQATITPTSSSSKILVIVDHSNSSKAGNVSSGIRMWLYRDSTLLRQAVHANGYTGVTGTHIFGINFRYYDSPATTSPITYKTTFNNYVAAYGVTVQEDDFYSYMTLVEVAQ